MPMSLIIVDSEVEDEHDAKDNSRRACYLPGSLTFTCLARDDKCSRLR